MRPSGPVAGLRHHRCHRLLLRHLHRLRRRHHHHHHPGSPDRNRLPSRRSWAGRSRGPSPAVACRRASSPAPCRSSRASSLRPDRRHLRRHAADPRRRRRSRRQRFAGLKHALVEELLPDVIEGDLQVVVVVERGDVRGSRGDAEPGDAPLDRFSVGTANAIRSGARAASCPRATAR